MNKTEKIILLGLAVLVALLLVAVLFSPKPAPKPVVGQFVPPPFDANAVKGAPTVEFPQIYGTLKLNDDAMVRLYSTPVVEDGKLLVLFTTAEENACWVRLRICDEKGNVLGQTGLLRAGEYVEYVELSQSPKSKNLLAKILTYEPETYYSLGTANVNLQLR